MISSSLLTFGSLVSGEGLRGDELRGLENSRSSTIVSESDPVESNTSQVIFISYKTKIPGEDTVGREDMAMTGATVLLSAFVDARFGAEDTSSRETGSFCFWAAGFARGLGILDTNSPS